MSYGNSGFIRPEHVSVGHRMEPDSDDQVTLLVMGNDYVMEPATAMVLAERLRKKAEMARGDNE